MTFDLASVSLLVSLAVLPLVAHAQVSEPQIAGRVVSADSGLPIEGAAIVLDPGWVSSNGQFPTATTDSDGNYRFVDLNPGVYAIKASAEGFVWQTYSHGATSDGQRQRVDGSTRLRGIDFQLQREAVIRGALTNAQGDPA